MGINTDLLHAGVSKNETGSTLPPVYQSSAFEQEIQLHAFSHQGFGTWSRHSN